MTLQPLCVATTTRCDANLVHDHRPAWLRYLPFAVEDRPEDLVEILAVAEERAAPEAGRHRAAQDAFLPRADLPERRVAAPVLDRRARFEPMHADGLEREAHDLAGAFDEDARAPELGAHAEAPLRRPEPRLELPDLEQPDG